MFRAQRLIASAVRMMFFYSFFRVNRMMPPVNCRTFKPRVECIGLPNSKKSAARFKVLETVPIGVIGLRETVPSVGKKNHRTPKAPRFCGPRRKPKLRGDSYGT
jgi:hypothetical protein